MSESQEMNEGGTARIHEAAEPTRWYRVDVYYPNPIPTEVEQGATRDADGADFRPGETHFEEVGEAWDRLLGDGIAMLHEHTRKERAALAGYLTTRYDAAMYRDVVLKLLARRIQAIEGVEDATRTPASLATLRRVEELASSARGIDEALLETASALVEGGEDDLALDMIDLARRFRRWRGERPHLDPGVFGPP